MQTFLPMTLGTLITVGFAMADECIVSDDFNGWSGIWSLHASDPSAMQVVHQNNRLYLNSHSGNSDPVPAFAAAISYGWKIDMTQDWAMQADWFVNPPTPIAGDVGAAFILLMEGDPTTMDLHRAWTIGAGTYHVAEDTFEYESSLIWRDNQYYGQQIDYFRETQDTVYIWWNSHTKTIYAHDTLHDTSNAFSSYLGSTSSSNDAWVGFGGYILGSVDSFSQSMWVDNMCVLYGNSVGGEVGACCMGDECVQVAEAACIGTFAGLGTSCGGCLCSAAADCLGDLYPDQVVDLMDLSLLLNVWGTETCDYDIDGSGTVGMLDLLALLRNWGSCS